MKKKIVILCLLWTAVFVSSFGQTMNQDYSVIRGEIVKNVFKAYGETFPDSVDASKYTKTTQYFKNDLSVVLDSAQKKYIPKNEYKHMLNTLGNMPALQVHENNEDLKTHVDAYLEQAVAGCKKDSKDITWAEAIGTKIKETYTKYDESANEAVVESGQPVEDSSEVKAVDTSSIEPVPEEQDWECKNSPYILDILLVVILGAVIGGALVVGGVAGFHYIKNRGRKKPKQESPTTAAPPEPIAPQPAPTEPEPPIPSPEKGPDPAPPIPAPPIPPSPKGATWVLVGASVKGNGHIQSNMPCQDNHKFESIGNGWGVAIVSDGAGSAAHSELGSKVVAERGVFHFKNLIEKEGWQKNNTLPTDMEWWQKSYDVLKTIRDEVALVAQKNNVEVKSLSATCLAVIYSPLGLLAVHVGDGRMGYKSIAGEWKAMMTPHKGEEANQTIFLVSDFWSIPNFKLSGVLVPEVVVVREPVKAFALMSDGCENTAWKCTTLNQETGKYYDQNKPFEGFFNPLEETLLSFYKDNTPEEEQQSKWHRFIESGTTGFVKEQDDKTMIYGINVTL